MKSERNDNIESLCIEIAKQLDELDKMDIEKPFDESEIDVSVDLTTKLNKSNDDIEKQSNILKHTNGITLIMLDDYITVKHNDNYIGQINNQDLETILTALDIKYIVN